MNNLENTITNETIATSTNGANRYNLKKIDTEIIKNQVLMKNTFYAFKKAGNCLICLPLSEIGVIFVVSIIISAIFSSFLPDIISIIIFIALFIYGTIFIRNKNRREAYERYLENQMIAIYKNDLATLNLVPENVDYQTIKMIEVSGENYDIAKYNLIRAAFYLGADGIINITHSATAYATSNVKGSISTDSLSKVTGNINTDTKITTNVYMQGMAIKLI
ncbi:hypothetical protein PJV93_03100 [Aliarcobacter butzleri]|uniref:Uncharacterized protein n=1 Tax=Aliarcobacter butzleri TaxID=28197 RepID=A0AAW7Q929_9BACT|nr:hypothetical protein [Aliarcobacter butzleri]MDN5107564.1 hypothetical protein [Aliarcobacter butzleri]MDN5122888.1 hypothetical protein [Aliarcobacter butzleri]